MYYDKGMKRTFFAFWVCLFPLGGMAQSTCETRVDAHPHATTKQRVKYCLTEPAETAANNPGLVFSGVMARQPQEETRSPKPTSREGYFEPGKVRVGQEWVASEQFPAFKNNKLSEREIWLIRQSEAQQAAPADASGLQPVDKQMEPLDVQVVETKAGLKARKTKPGRQLREGVAQEESLAVTDLAAPAAQEETQPVDPYAYDSTAVQPYAPATPDAQEYVPAVQDAQDYVPVEPVAQPYEPQAQAEIPVGTSSYAPAN